jgi:hypothetical protein
MARGQRRAGERDTTKSRLSLTKPRWFSCSVEASIQTGRPRRPSGCPDEVANGRSRLRVRQGLGVKHRNSPPEEAGRSIGDQELEAVEFGRRVPSCGSAGVPPQGTRSARWDLAKSQIDEDGLLSRSETNHFGAAAMIKFLLTALSVILFTFFSSAANAIIVDVDATSDIFAAGLSSVPATDTAGNPGGNGTIPVFLYVTGGQAVTLTATGLVNCCDISPTPGVIGPNGFSSNSFGGDLSTISGTLRSAAASARTTGLPLRLSACSITTSGVAHFSSSPPKRLWSSSGRASSFLASPMQEALMDPQARKKLTCSDCATDSPVVPQAWLMSRAVSVPQRSQDRRVV